MKEILDSNRSTVYAVILSVVAVFSFISLSGLDGESQPRFSEFEPDNPKSVHENLTGQGTDSSPYLITDIEVLNAVRVSKNSTFKLQNDIDASATENWNAGKGFEPIGEGDIQNLISSRKRSGNNTSQNSTFTGKILGNDKTIEDLYINREDENKVGLIGYGRNFEIDNLIIEAANITGGKSTAILVGDAGYNVRISDASVDGRVKGANRTAGVVGNFADAGIISNSQATVKVHGIRFVGGITGFSEFNTTIEDSTSVSNIEGEEFAIGGVSGRNSGTIINSTSRSSVKGNYRVGGMVGDLSYGREGFNPEIIDSFSDSNVEGEMFVGSFVGYMGSVGAHSLEYTDEINWETRIVDSYYTDKSGLDPIGRHNRGPVDLSKK